MTEPIKLPPLPYPQIPGDDYTASDLREYARAAIEVDRQARGEPVAWSILDKRTGKHWYTHDSKYTAQHYANEYSHRESDGTPSMVVEPLYTAPQPPQIPEGYKLVPIEPTVEMLLAGDAEFGKRKIPSISGICYKAMLAAAPEVKP